MGKIIAGISILMDSVALRLSAFSLRHLVAVLGLSLALVPVSLSSFTAYDKVWAYVASSIQKVSAGPAEIAIVTVADSDMAVWEGDLYAAGGLSALVANILHSSNAHVGIVFDKALSLGASDLDTRIQAIDAVKHSMEQPSISQTVKQKHYLSNLLRDRRVTLGVHGKPSMPENEISKTQSAGEALVERLPSYIDRWIGPTKGCKECETAFLPTLSEPFYWLPLADKNKGIVFYGNTERLAPSFVGVAHFRSRLQDEIPESLMPLSWDGKNRLYSGDKALLVSSYGNTLPLYSVFTSLTSRKIMLNYSEAVAASAFPDLVLIGSEKNRAALLRTADTLYSLQQGAAYYAPWWAELGLRGLLIFITFYCVVVQAGMRSAKRAVLVPLFCILASLGLSLYLAVTKNMWLPQSIFPLWALLACVLMMVWRVQQRKSAETATLRDEALWQASFVLEKNQHFSEAISLLTYHSHHDTLSERLCQLSDGLVEKVGNVDLALTLLDEASTMSGEPPKLQRHIAHLQQVREKKGVASALDSKPAADASSWPSELGRYRIEKEIGRGAVGVVYLGFDPAISRNVAIKTLDMSQFSTENYHALKQRFYREAEAAGRLNHPGIVSIYDVGEQEDLAYIAMDFAAGQALNCYIQEDTLLPVSEVYRIIHDVALALDYAHKHQIVHRDIKPSNIMYAEHPYQIKVADFGIARLLDNSKTSTGEILGSPLYMAPEQLKGSKVDARADIFSLGVSLYQLLTGHVPFNADNLASLTYEIIHTRHKSVRTIRKDLPASAARIVNQCLQKDALDRYESATELATVIKKAIKRDFPNDALAFGLI